MLYAVDLADFPRVTDGQHFRHGMRLEGGQQGAQPVKVTRLHIDNHKIIGSEITRIGVSLQGRHAQLRKLLGNLRCDRGMLRAVDDALYPDRCAWRRNFYAGLHRQIDQQAECRALAFHAGHLNCSIHELCNLFADRQPKAGAFKCTVFLIFNLIELSEDIGNLVLRNSDPGVRHINSKRHFVIHDLAADGHFDMSLQREFDRVANQIG